MMVKVSYLISTNKPLQQTAMLHNIAEINNDCEVLVYSSCEQYVANKIKVMRTNEDQGSTFGYNLLYKMSKGEYICCISDYCILPDNINDLYDHMKSSNLEAATLTACNHVNKNGKLKNGKKAYCKLTDCSTIKLLSIYKKYDIDNVPILFYPVLKRSVVDDHLEGFIYNHSMKHRWIDNWISVWLAKRGVKNIEELEKFVCHSGACKSCKDVFNRRRNATHDKDDEIAFSWLWLNANSYLDEPKISAEETKELIKDHIEENGRSLYS